MAYHHMTEKDRIWTEDMLPLQPCSYVAGCENVALDNEYGLCDYHMEPIDGRADPYRDAAPYIGDDV